MQSNSNITLFCHKMKINLTFLKRGHWSCKHLILIQTLKKKFKDISKMQPQIYIGTTCYSK